MNILKQIFYRVVTQPIARILDFINIPKRQELKQRRDYIAEMNKNEYIQITSNIMFEAELQEKLNQGYIISPLVIPLVMEKHLYRAKRMFYEKKRKGYFDDLNLMIK